MARVLTHYDMLEVSPVASAEVVRAAYKSLMQRYHPDKNREKALNGGLEKTAAQIAHAYGVLSDPRQRAVYDLELQSAVMHRPAATSPVPRRKAASRAPVTSTAPHASTARYAAWLIAVIVLAGGLLLWFQSKAPRKLAAADTSSGAQLKSSQTEVSTESRLLPRFAADLTVAIVGPDGAARELRIPQLGFRVLATEPGRWLLRIEAQREVVLARVMARLAQARPEDLIGADGELYLLRQIAIAANEALMPVTASVTGVGVVVSAAPPLPPPVIVEALLPQSYSLR